RRASWAMYRNRQLERAHGQPVHDLEPAAAAVRPAITQAVRLGQRAARDPDTAARADGRRGDAACGRGVAKHETRDARRGVVRRERREELERQPFGVRARDARDDTVLDAALPAQRGDNVRGTRPDDELLPRMNV